MNLISEASTEEVEKNEEIAEIVVLLQRDRSFLRRPEVLRSCELGIIK